MRGWMLKKDPGRLGDSMRPGYEEDWLLWARV